MTLIRQPETSKKPPTATNLQGYVSLYILSVFYLNFRLGKVCKLWHSVSCKSHLWKNVDLAQYTVEKCKTDYKLVWLLENRLSQCQILNIGKKGLLCVQSILLLFICLISYCLPALSMNIIIYALKKRFGEK